ncbi:MAG: oligosaccharide flippase family protein [Burkholderiales bacterium]|nr:oligosaccharide flippase family protein [Burkholderiales bacterium]
MRLIRALAERWRSHKLTRDIGWTLASFAVLALSGMVINLVVAGVRDASALGVFNQAYAVYIIASQLATLGLHYSVLRHAALHEADQDDGAVRGRMFFTAAVCALALGALAAVVVGYGAGLLATLFDSEATGRAVAWAATGLLLFSLNKVLLAYLNGLRRMRAFAILQGLRYLVVMAVVCAVAASPLPIETATVAFLVAEAVTVAGALAYLVRHHLARHLHFDRDWLRTHLRFGAKGLAAGMFAEFNSRIDVLLIGVFLPDREVGIYSFAAMMVDGVYHVLAMIRINFNPVLVGSLRDGDHAQATGLRRQSARFVLPATLAMGLAAVAALWVLATWVVPHKDLHEGMPSLLILMSGLVLVSALVPFDNLLMVSGHPGYQTLQQVITVAANAAVAVALLPVLGIAGAACGTALSYLAGAAALLVFSRRIVGWNLLANRFEKT